jgi:plasmid stabilization system protein ParE
MAKSIVWTKRANSSLNSIIQYIEKEWGLATTNQFVKRVYDVIELLSEYPNLGTQEHQEKPIRGFVISKQNKIFYRITKQEIIILNVFDNRSGPKRKKF